MSEGPLSLHRDGVRIAIRLTPGAKTDRIQSIAAAAGIVKVSVTAPPEAGRANEALLRLLARAWRVPRRDLTVVTGLTSRMKTVHVAGDPPALTARIGALVAALPRR